MASAGNYDLLIGKIDLFIRKYYLNKLLRGLIFLGAGLFSAYIVITLCEYFGNFNTLVRTFLFYFFIALNTGLILWLVMPPLLAWMQLGKTISHDEAASIIGRHFHDVNDKLINTLQLKKLAGSDPRQRDLIEASIDQKIELLKPVSFPSAINIRQNSKYLKWAIIPAGVICIIAFAAPAILTESTKRIIRHDQYFAPIAPFSFSVINKSLSVVQGDDLPLDVKLTGNRLPADVYVETAGNTFKLDKQNLSHFKYLFTNLQQNTTFTLSANGYVSQPYTIKVNLKPLLLHFEAALNYPAYLHKKNEVIQNAADLTIPAGTQVKWQLHTQNSTGIIFSINNNKYTLIEAQPNLFEHTERIVHNTSYSIRPQNLTADHTDSSAYHINVIADEMPSIVVQEKQDSVSMRALYFNGDIADDHGFSSLTFHYKIETPGNKSREFVKPVKADLDRSQTNFFYFWSLKDLGAKPGDHVTYYFEVADNDEVAGPKRVRSAEHTLNLPTDKALNDQLNAGTQQIKQKMESAAKMASQVERDAQKLNELLLNKNNLSFDEKKQIQDLLEKRKELENLVKDIQTENKKNDYNRQEGQQQNKQITEKQKQMESLLNNLLDKKTQDMLQRLQEMMQQNYKQATQDELQQVQQDNKSLKKELDRMLELYKKLDMEQKLDQTVNQLNQLADKQQKLSDDTKKPGADQKNIAQQQQQLKQDFQDIKKQLDDLQKTNDQLENKSKFENPKKDEQNIDQKMDESSGQMQKGQQQQASQSQQQASQQMKQMAGKLSEQNQAGEQQQTNIDMRQLRELLKDLVNSSFDQEKVMQTLKSTNMTDPNYIALAQKQKDIKDNLKTAEDSLYALSKRVPQIQSTVNEEVTSINDHIDKALDDLGDRRTPEANRNQQYAMTSMNNLALMLSEALSQLQKAMQNGGNGGSSKKQSMSQLAKMQQQLNQNMQNARDQMQKQGKSPSKSQQAGMSEQLARMARQQQEIRQALEQINKDETKDGRNGLGDLNKISKQMEQTEKDIVNRRITDEALKRQQQIQSRLLEAEKAEQEREQDQQRESNAGKDLPPGYIKALQDYQQLKTKQTEQIKTVSPALNLYYKQKIKSYFDQLNAK